jgi:hypothetical protein
MGRKLIEPKPEDEFQKQPSDDSPDTRPERPKPDPGSPPGDPTTDLDIPPWRRTDHH